MTQPFSDQSKPIADWRHPAFRPKVPYFCEHFITPAEMGCDDEWAGTYCKLPAGHDEPHSALYADERGQA